MGDKEFRILIGLILLLIAIFGVGRILTLILAICGAYLIYSGVRKKK